MMPKYAELVCLACTICCLGTCTAPPVFNSRISPRGWQAAREASEQLVTKLKGKRTQALSSPAAVSEHHLAQPAPSRADESDRLTRKARDLEQQAKSIRNAQQLALPALALSLVSGLLGWTLRGWENKRSHREAAESLAQRETSEQALRGSPSGCSTEKAAVENDSSVAASRSEADSELGLADAPDTGDVELPENRSGTPPTVSEPDTPPRSGSLSNSVIESLPTPSVDRDEGAARTASTAGSISSEEALHKASVRAGDWRESSRKEAFRESTQGNEPAPPATDAKLRKAPGTSSKSQGTSPGWLRRARDQPSSVQQQKGSAKQQLSGLEAVDDITVIMEALAVRLCLEEDQLIPQERMQLLQMALQCCQHRENSWLHAQANEIRFSHASAAHGTLKHHKEQAIEAEERRERELFRASLEDGLLTGLSLMLVTLLLCGVTCGYLGARLGKYELKLC